MNRKEKLDRLRQMLKSIAPGEGLERVAARATAESYLGGGLESLGGERVDEHFESAQSGIRRVAENADDDDISDSQLNALEAIVLPRERPVVFIQDNGFKTPPTPWQHFSRREIKDKITAAIPSVGRIELPDSPWIPYGGTGFVVGDELLMTNRHVAELFASGLGERIRFKPGQSAKCDFREEHQRASAKENELVVHSVVMIHPYWDMALLRIKGLSTTHSPLKLSVVPPEDLVGHDVAVIGYPAKDVRNDIKLQDQIFERTYNVKRLHPGKLRERDRIKSFSNEVNALTHDSSTLGGNSGSAVLDVKSGQIVGLHFAGIYLKSNYAVPTWELARDSRVVDAGVNFVGKVPLTQEWALAWRSAEGIASQTTIPADDEPQKSRPLPRPVDVRASHSGKITITIPLNVTVSLE